MPSGDEALAAAADCLYQSLKANSRIAEYFGDNVEELGEVLRSLLEPTFDGGFPNIAIADNLFTHTSLDGLVDVVLEALERPLPLDEDSLVAALRLVISDFSEDERVTILFEQLRRSVSIEDEEEEYADGLNRRGSRVTMTDVITDSLDELFLPQKQAQEVQDAWKAFLDSYPTREIAGETIYAALFDSAPSLQSLFKTPRAVMSMRFMMGINQIIMSLQDPKQCKAVIEAIGFQHLDLEVTVPRIAIFRDAIMDLVASEMGSKVSASAAEGLAMTLNYAGGGYIFIREKFSERVKILASSWKTANAEDGEDDMAGDEEPAEAEEENAEGEEENAEEEAKVKEGSGESEKIVSEKDMKNSQGVPTTFDEMFRFNAAVMGFANNTWMFEVLNSFDAIVKNVANSYRLQEECDVLALKMAQIKGTVKLGDYKAVMLASIRSLVPKDWDGAHEVAWNWLWDNVERMLEKQLELPAPRQRYLSRFLGSLEENTKQSIRQGVFVKFFALAPSGQDYFKQSTTRLFFIADKILDMTLDMYKNPHEMVDDISALGLRHVGYGIPTEFFSPFVTGCVEVVRELTGDETLADAFGWSLGLISRMLSRTINEGSTIVMKAVNSDSERTLRRAVSIAPRGKRALWMLNITVGTQSISPLYWAIESGSLSTANAMIKDLFVIRADRDNYYYGCDDLFERHPEIIQRLSTDAPMLLPTLMDGLIWRSHMSEGNRRRVNYYIKHLIQDKEEKFNQALEWLVQSKDPQIICHEVVTIFADLLWNRLANRLFLYSRLYFMLTLSVFIISQAILPHLGDGAADTETVRILTFVCRVFIYVGSMGQLLKNQVKQLRSDCKSRNFIRIGWLRIPGYLTSKQDAGYLVLFLLLALMCLQEPIFWCASHSTGDFPGAGMFTQDCPQAKTQKAVYANTSMFAMMLKWLLLTDLTIFSMRISAYVLVCNHVLSELCLFLLALTFLVGTFSCSIAALDTGSELFLGVPESSLSLTQIALRMFDAEQFHVMEEEETLIIAVSVFVIIVIAFLSQLLVAQISAAYRTIHENMVGYARLNRGHVIVVTMEGVSPKQWNKFLASLGFDVCLEFNEGDIGLPGGIQVLEDANAVPTTKDAIVRFGGSTHPSMPWPEDKTTIMDDGDDDKFDRLEKQLSKISKKLDELPSGGGGKKKQDGSSYGETGTGSFGASSSDSE
eukprot:TRINITY_DN6540_c0_g1_i1.p1 TRINITY_DN6540_c0_g1~~TRINITY_DN6540_c0_g1_i1.p1  ORF type:complete len:1197 (-),score=226.04 TRINITY_DN6540_c0_g1_i1:101-3667(-)